MHRQAADSKPSGNGVAGTPQGGDAEAHRRRNGTKNYKPQSATKLCLEGVGQHDGNIRRPGGWVGGDDTASRDVVAWTGTKFAGVARPGAGACCTHS